MAEYLTESEASIERRRRQRRTTITLVVVTLMMLGTFFYAAAYYQGWVGNRPTPGAVATPTCGKDTPAPALAPRALAINVYNATERPGLAASVAKSLRSQGFKVVNVANDPLGKAIGGVGEVRHGPTGVVGATLMATRLSGAKVVKDARADGTVDLVLGSKFMTLSAPPKVAAPKAGSPAPSC
jgi:LytR cell envelope-related transcriptional attenuator